MFRSNLSLGSFGFRDIEISGFGVVPMHVSSPVNGVFIKKNFNDYIQTLREKMRSSEPLTLEKKDAVFKELEQRLRDGDGQTLWHNVFSFLINHLDNRKLRESLQVDSEIQNIFVEELIDVIKDFLIRCMDSDIYPTHLVVKVTLEQIKNTIFFGFEDHTGNVPVKRAIFKVDLSKGNQDSSTKASSTTSSDRFFTRCVPPSDTHAESDVASSRSSRYPS